MDPATRRRRLWIVFGSIFALPVVAVLVYLFAPATGFSPEALGYSVARAADTGTWDDLACDRHVEGWSCVVADMGASGWVDYRVEMEGSRCWHGRRLGRGGPHALPARIDGCLKLRDQLRLWDRLL